MTEPMTFTKDYLDKAANEIDAAMFSGDDFFDAANRAALREWIARWERKLTVCEEMALEIEDNEE